jgi:hypothetical protein
MKLFTKDLTFEPVDPLGDGLREAIAAEQGESEAIRLVEDGAAESLQHAWEEIVHDVESDPEWFHFAGETE